MQREKKKFSKIALALYIIAAVFAVVALFSLYNVTTYIVSLSGQGMDLQSQLTDVVMYYISNCAAWIFDAAVLFGIGYLIQQLTTDVPKTADNQMMVIEEVAEDGTAAGEADAKTFAEDKIAGEAGDAPEETLEKGDEKADV